MSFADSSLSLAPRRRTSLAAKARPMTACGIPQEMSNYSRRRHSELFFFTAGREDYDAPRASPSYEFRPGTTSTPNALRSSMFSARTNGEEKHAGTHTRRPSTIGQSIKQGVSELRSLGRRLSITVRGKGGKTKQEHGSCPSAWNMAEAQRELDERPKSRGWFRTPSTRRRPSLPLLNFVDEPSPPRYSIIGPVPGSSRGPPILPDNLQSGAGARAAAAAQNEAFHATRSPPLPPMEYLQTKYTELKLVRDSESGIGIDVETHSRRASEVADTNVARFDPTVIFATELMEHVLGFLDPGSLLQAGQVSRKWRSVTMLQSVWRSVFLREYSSGLGTTFPCGQQMARGLGNGSANQDWRKMFKIRKLIDKRWERGEAAAIYLNGHSDSVYCVQFDGNKIITGSRDHTVRVWDAHTYQCIRKLGPPNNARDRHQLQRAEVEPHGVQPFCTIEFSSQDPISAPLPEWHSQSILCLQYDDEIMVTGSSDYSCLVWSIKDNYTPIFRLRGHTAGVLDVCIDETRIITCSKDTTIKIWDRYTGILMRTLGGHRGPVNAIQLRGNLLASASGDGMSKLWRLEDGLCIKEFSSQDRGLACVEFSEDGRTIFAGGNDQVIYEYDTMSGSTIRELKGHTDLVRSLHFDSANGRIISGSYDAAVKVWDSKRGTDSQDGGLKINFEGWTTSWILAAKSDYRKIVCTSQDGRVVIIDFGYGIDGADILEA